jgi:hypothetical protein
MLTIDIGVLPELQAEILQALHAIQDLPQLHTTYPQYMPLRKLQVPERALSDSRSEFELVSACIPSSIFPSSKNLLQKILLFLCSDINSTVHREGKSNRVVWRDNVQVGTMGLFHQRRSD